MSTVDYSGRILDAEFMQHVVGPAKMITLDTTLRKDGASRRVTGVHKVAQRYALILMTPRGTLPQYPSYGTNLSTLIHNGAVANRSQLATLFAFANSLTMDQLAAEAQPTDPDDEVLVSATLIDYDIDYSSLSVLLRILLKTRAGITYTYVIPA